MTQSEKLKGLIESAKTTNQLMIKQIEINNRTIDLIGDLITEPESLTEKMPIEIPTHGGNDVPNIPQVTDEQL
jgi:hypothetical protein